ncbi:MAG: tRNA uridine-5-carboxymethylaminomethyl(34) synthesis GTPase MnmE [Arenicella sp.]
MKHIKAQKHSKDLIDTIAAIATPPGKGGVGIVRISGPNSLAIAKKITAKKDFIARYATYVSFLDDNADVIDSGIALFFKGPNSFTGEDVVELQGHGGPVILQMLLSRVVKLGARQAKPGEFSERAFLNNKLDLAQAEAIADLIESSSEAAAKSAVRSLQGEFSSAVNQLLTELINIRMYVESAIDFPEEEIDFLGDGIVLSKLESVQGRIAEVQAKAGTGQLLQNGFRIALAGRPNAGKSTLINALSGYEAAIVTDIEGTTRDSITVTVDFDGLPIHITDTAGLRDSDNTVEKIGVERAKKVIQESDHILLLVDIQRQGHLAELLTIEQVQNVEANKLTILYTKSDMDEKFSLPENNQHQSLVISAKNSIGITSLKQRITELAGYSSEESNVFSARARHLNAIQSAAEAVTRGKQQLLSDQAGELLAFELLTAQNELNSITGEFNADDLLGEIFSSFCIGK